MLAKLTRLFVLGIVAFAAACAEGTTPTGIDPDAAEQRSGEDDDDRSGLPTIAEIAVDFASAEENPEFTILVAALQAADLVETFNGKGQFTVFAPTDAAFGRLLELLDTTAEELLANTELLTEVLKYHVAKGRRYSEDVLDSEKIRTLQGDFLYPVLTDEGAFLRDTNEATEDAQLLAPDLIDVEARNGVIHVIDEVLLFGDDRPEKEDDDDDDEDDDRSDLPSIAEIAISLATADENPEFTVLVAALEAAELVEAFDGKGQYTVFAPTDAAFGRLLELLDTTAEELLANKELLRQVLKYHVAKGRRYSEDVLDSDQIRTLQEGFLYPLVTDEGAFIRDTNADTEDAQLLAPELIDIEARNGVIHVIDEVLLFGDDRPEKEDDDDDDDDDEGETTIAGLVKDFASADEPEFTVLLAALEAAHLVDAFDGKGQYTVFAPTDAAFGRLLELLDTTAEELLGNEELLREVLKYHVAEGRRDAEDVLESEKIRMLQEGYVYPMVTDEGAFIVDGNDLTEDAQILIPDVFATNGVVHVIDEVLLPGSDD